MSNLLQTETASLLRFACESSGGCQLGTAAVAPPSSVCLPGSAGAGGVCPLCSPGTFTNLTDEAECRNCTAGSYQELAGQAACVACPLGHACPVMCAAGFFADAR